LRSLQTSRGMEWKVDPRIPEQGINSPYHSKNRAHLCNAVLYNFLVRQIRLIPDKQLIDAF
jgi:hypothetical protein